MDAQLKRWAVVSLLFLVGCDQLRSRLNPRAENQNRPLDNFILEFGYARRSAVDAAIQVNIQSRSYELSESGEAELQQLREELGPIIAGRGTAKNREKALALEERHRTELFGLSVMLGATRLRTEELVHSAAVILDPTLREIAQRIAQHHVELHKLAIELEAAEWAKSDARIRLIRSPRSEVRQRMQDVETANENANRVHTAFDRLISQNGMAWNEFIGNVKRQNPTYASMLPE